MKNLFSSLIALLMISVMFIYSCNKSTEKPVISKDSLIKKGEYLVTVMGCNDCHTPKKFGPKGPELDMDKLLSGHPENIPVAKVDTSLMKDWVYFNHLLTVAVGPWGVSFSANLTPDATGIGSWSEEQFKKALKEGKFKGLDGTRTLLPPMPWQNFHNISDEDVSAMYAYLKSIKPIKNLVPNPIPPDKIPAM
ncbi:MAG TPA: diheme cytochrome c-553 [Bacteroidetes bacterium]|nr:diheme cytochrome c-553 [Bacteroidota bacterium]HCN36846.1 diheme cytochrome c-553 [Bacteroidota bacterium]